MIIEEREGAHEDESNSDVIEEESALEFTRQSVQRDRDPQERQ